MLLIILGVKRN